MKWVFVEYSTPSPPPPPACCHLWVDAQMQAKRRPLWLQQTQRRLAALSLPTHQLGAPGETTVSFCISGSWHKLGTQ